MKIMIAVPCMREIQTPTFVSIWAMRDHVNEGDTVVKANTESTVIHDARDKLAKTAIEMECDRVLWIDSDMKFRPDILERLSADMDEGREMVTGLYVTRRPPIYPVIYNRLDYDPINKRGTADYYADYPRDSVFKIRGCGFGGVMTSVDLLKKVAREFGQPFAPLPGLGEDLSFCWRVNQLGVKIYCNSFVTLGHIGTYEYTIDDYLGARDESKD